LAWVSFAQRKTILYFLGADPLTGEWGRGQIAVGGRKS
jgi:hypothetical protein